MKRLFDIFLSLAAIVVLSPLLIPITIILIFTGEGEVFYLQERVGYKGKIFRIIKLATMLKDSPSIGSGDITVKDDQRVLPLGRFLRKTKLNELPQLINVLVGDMSIIGPRPLTPRVLALFDDEYGQILEIVRPGVSGIGSVAFRNEEELLEKADDSEQAYREHIVPYKSELEQWYVGHLGLWTDLKIILLTILVIIFPARDWSVRLFGDLPRARGWKTGN